MCSKERSLPAEISLAQASVMSEGVSLSSAFGAL